MKMSILVDRNTRVVVQGITGRHGSFQTKLMLDYGTNIVAGVTPGKGGTKVWGIPVYDTMDEAVSKHYANTSIIFVPAPYAKDAILEALDSEIKLVVVITEHIPIKDMIEINVRSKFYGARIIGPNTPGIITPGESKVGIMPGHIFTPGIIGMVSRSGTLTYEIASKITESGLGQTTCLGIGGDPIVGLSFIDVLEMFREDNKTKAVVVVGEIGGNMEEETAKYIQSERYEKPVVAYIAGRVAPMGKRMGHAGAIITGRAGTAITKIESFRAAGVEVGDTPGDVAKILMEKLKL
jgi:succinyl-CoA synthetase alpha subunit